MPFQKFIYDTYTRVRTLISSVYSWFERESENPPEMLARYQDQQQENQENERELIQPPQPPPMPPIQIFAGMQLPFLHRNRPSLRDLLLPLAEVLADRPTTPQPQLRLGKRWRIENQEENVQAIEKALEEFEKEEILTISEEATQKNSRDLVQGNSDELQMLELAVWKPVS